MTTSRKRFAIPQRLLHWLMAICILSMLFIGVGMVSTAAPKYLTLVQIHKPLRSEEHTSELQSPA